MSVGYRETVAGKHLLKYIKVNGIRLVMPAHINCKEKEKS